MIISSTLIFISSIFLLYLHFLPIATCLLIEDSLPNHQQQSIDIDSDHSPEDHHHHKHQKMENNVVVGVQDETGLINSLITWLTTTSLLSNSRLLFRMDDDCIPARNGVVSDDGTSDCEVFDRRASIWAWSTLASILIAFTGVVPAIFLSSRNESYKKEGSDRTLNRLLSFAVGSLLGDVFLHILPETWRSVSGDDHSHWGMWVIFGSVLCFMVEKCASNAEDSKHKAAAFVNLCANAIDNFTHGLAVGASFSVSIKFGMLTTFAILIHEIPHEISDFAILLRADFDRWSAIKAQLITATGGLFGATVALMSHSGSVAAAGLERRASCWILPFTAGGFLNVALVQVLPDLLKEKSMTESAMQLLYILTGVALMGIISSMHV